jgi:hypothetical protein
MAREMAAKKAIPMKASLRPAFVWSIPGTIAQNLRWSSLKELSATPKPEEKVDSICELANSCIVAHASVTTQYCPRSR